MLPDMEMVRQMVAAVVVMVVTIKMVTIIMVGHIPGFISLCTTPLECTNACIMNVQMNEVALSMNATHQSSGHPKCDSKTNTRWQWWGVVRARQSVLQGTIWHPEVHQCPTIGKKRCRC
jgi:hypothetical protein